MCRSSEREKIAVLLAVLAVLCPAACADPPLPTHQVEGNSGVFITPVAYLANPAGPNEVFGVPSVSATYAHLEKKDFESFAVTENLWGRVEFGYALERVGLGDWPGAVQAATGARVQDEAFLHNFNARLMAIKEGSLGYAWTPAVTLGAHLKWHQDLGDLDEQLGGTCALLGADHETGLEFTLMATKMIKDLLPKPLIVSAGLRNGDAIQTGLLGFAGERKFSFEGSLIYFLTDKLLIATEYRQKPDLMEPCSANGRELVKSESDWWDVALAYIVNDHITVAGGYANFGNILNNREDNVWAVQVKYEF
ncbi:MAG: DUF3034 family protein [Planctomycetes bacterium]|nr:DUF3034 family protein [Planctomycetota bacterium]